MQKQVELQTIFFWELNLRLYSTTLSKKNKINKYNICIRASKDNRKAVEYS